MKVKLLALLMAGLLLLSGCAAMTSRDYLSIASHKSSLTTEDDPTVFKAENYTKLVDDIHSMVEAGLSHGVVHLFNYRPRNAKGDVETDLANACAEVAQADALGAYAVDFIKHDKSYIVSYYEANIYINYRRTQQQVKNIVSVTGSSAIRAEIQETLSTFSTEKVLRISYFNETADSIQALVRQAYYTTPLFALGMPEIEVVLYPANREDQPYTETLRIVEILLTYPEDQDTLRDQALALATKAQEVGDSFLGLGKEIAAREIYRYVKEQIALPAGGQPTGRVNTAYAALIGGTADSEGKALAFQLLCQQAGLESYVVSGGVERVPRYWNIVALPDGEYRHVDVGLDEGFGLSDADLVAMGYAWNRDEYKACGAQPPPPEESKTAELEITLYEDENNT